MKSDPFAGIPLFDGLPAPERERWSEQAVLRQFPPGAILFDEGQPCEGLWVLRSGSVRIVKTNPAGRQIMLAQINAPGTVAEAPVFDGGPYPASVIAAAATEALLIRREQMFSAIRQYPDLAIHLIVILGQRLRTLVALAEQITFGTVRQRLASYLLDLPSGELPTHEEIAASLGTAREVVTRNLARFQADGLIAIKRRELFVLDPQGLRLEAATEL